MSTAFLLKLTDIADIDWVTAVQRFMNTLE